MACDYCLRSDESYKAKIRLTPGEEWRCSKCGEVWIADVQGNIQGVWIRDNV